MILRPAHEGTVMLCSSIEKLADNASASSNQNEPYEPRVMVRTKSGSSYALWIYDPHDWKEGTHYSNSFEIIAFAYTIEERDVLNATVEYHTNLMKEIKNA